MTKYTFLTNDDNKDVKSAAADALKEIGDTRALKPLNNALNDDDQEVRSAERRAIYKITKNIGEFFLTFWLIITFPGGGLTFVLFRLNAAKEFVSIYKCSNPYKA